MRCDKCSAWRTEGFEYPIAYCYIGNEPDKEFADGGDGCTMHHSTISKRIRETQKTELHQYDNFATWYREGLLNEECSDVPF